MFRSVRMKSEAPAIDLATVRDTIRYIQDDIERTPGMERIATALRTAVAEIDRMHPDGVEAPAMREARFVSW